MRIIDTCGYIGNWPFRQIVKNTIEDVDKLAADVGVDTMMIGSSNALLYKNAYDGNMELYNALQGKQFNTKFLPMAMINPSYTRWEEDAKFFIKELGFFGLEFNPDYMNCSYANEGAKLYRLASELGVPLRVNLEFENCRQAHHMDFSKPTIMTAALPMLNAGDAPVILNGFIGMDAGVAKLARERGNIFVDILRVDSFAANGLENFIDAIGVDNLCIGTRLPFSYAEPNLVKLAFCKALSDEDREKIAWKNISRIIK